MKMKSLLGVILAVSLLPAAWANAAELKIGIVDLKTALQNTKEYQREQNRINASAMKKQKELDALQARIEKEKSELQTKAMMMTPERLSQKQSELNDLGKQYERKKQDIGDALAKEINRVQAAQFSKLNKVLSEFGKKGGYDLIIHKTQQIPFILYSNPTHDVTAEITKLLDSQ